MRSDDSKFRRGGLSLNCEIVERSAEASFGRKHSGDAVEHAQICVLQNVLAIERCSGWRGTVPWPETAGHIQQSVGQWVVELHGKTRLTAPPQVSGFKFVKDEPQPLGRTVRTSSTALSAIRRSTTVGRDFDPGWFCSFCQFIRMPSARIMDTR